MYTMHAGTCTDKEVLNSLDLELEVSFELSGVGAENSIQILWKSSKPSSLTFLISSSQNVI